MDFKTFLQSWTWTSLDKILTLRSSTNFWRSLPIVKFRKFSTRSQVLAYIKNILLNSKEKPKMATFPFWDRNKTKSLRNWASANSNKSTEIFMERSSAKKLTRRKKSPILSSRMILVKSALSRTYKTSTILVITVLPLKLSRKLNKSPKNNTRSRSSSNTITQRSKLKNKCSHWVNKRDKK